MSQPVDKPMTATEAYERSTKRRRFIGDGVYAHADDAGQIWLTTNRAGCPGDPATDEQITLEPQTFISLVEFAREVWPVNPICVLCGHPKVT